MKVNWAGLRKEKKEAAVGMSGHSRDSRWEGGGGFRRPVGSWGGRLLRGGTSNQIRPNDGRSEILRYPGLEAVLSAGFVSEKALLTQQKLRESG